MTIPRRALTATLALVLAAVGIAASVAPAAAPAAPDNFFRTGELTPDVAFCGRQFYLPTVFGPTGMNGWILNDTLVVREVENGSPADGVVLPNDIILAVNGVKLGADPLKGFGQQIEACEQAGKMGLQILRAGKARSLTIPIRKLGAFSKHWPYDCAKSREIHMDACKYLARSQNTDGLFDGRIYVGFALNGLTWLASEDPAYWEHARRLAYGYGRAFNPDEDGTVNWGWGYMGVFLAEYYLQTGDRSVLPLCHEIAQALTTNQQPSGTWGHGKYPGGGYVQGGSLNNAGLVCWMALILFKEAGVPVNEPALARATRFFKRFAHRGCVAYGDHRPEFGGGNGKNAIPGVVYTILGDTAASEYCARWVTNGYTGRTGGHTGGYMGFIWGNVQGVRNPHYSDYRRMLDHWTWLMNVSRRWDGGFLLPASVIGHIYTYRGPVLSTGGMAQVYAMPAAALRIHGAPKGVFAKRDLPAELVEGLKLYRDRKFDQLRKLVKPTSALAKQLLTAADRKEKDIELTLAKFEAALAGGNVVGARRITRDFDRYTGGEDTGRGSRNWRIRISEDAPSVDAAATVYRRYKWLSYTHPGARAAFEKLAADDSAGVFQKLARRELATPPHASSWAFYCELMWNTYASTWRIDNMAQAGALRVTGIRGGNWPVIVALNTLHGAGILQKQLANWTPLFASSTGGYPGVKPTWRMLPVPKGQGPPAGWTGVDFDDSSWKSGAGPLAGRREEGMKPVGGATSHLRIAFDCDRTDFKRLLLGLRIQRGRAVVFLNGTPVLWSEPTQGPRQRIAALVPIDLAPNAVKLLRKGRNVLAVRVSASGADFGLYAIDADEALAFKPRPKAWAAGPVLDAPDLSVKTAARPTITTVLPPNTTGLTIDPPGEPNEDFEPLRRGLSERTMPIEQRAKYLGHPDPRIRRSAAWSLMAEGAKAMPYILKALDSKDIRVIRAGTDALTGGFNMNGRGTPELRAAMTPDIAAAAVPKLLPLLDHEDVFIRQGALLALSSCGEAATRHLDKITRLADDEDWWVRAGVAHVLHYTQQPETADHAAATIRNYLAEKSVFGKNRLREALVGMAKRGHGSDAIVKALIADGAVSALGAIGPNAKAAVGLITERIQQAKARVAKAKTDRARAGAERQVKNLEGLLRKINPASRPPRPPRKPRKPKK